MGISAAELEPFLIDFTRDESYMVRTKLATYLTLMSLMADATGTPRGIGFHKRVGWFVMVAGVDGNQPYLLWTERGGTLTNNPDDQQLA